MPRLMNLVHHLAHELPNDLRLRILGNQEIIKKTQNWVATQISAQQYPLQKSFFGKTQAKAEKHSGLVQFLLFFKKKLVTCLIKDSRLSKTRFNHQICPKLLKRHLLIFVQKTPILPVPDSYYKFQGKRRPNFEIIPKIIQWIGLWNVRNTVNVTFFVPCQAQCSPKFYQWSFSMLFLVVVTLWCYSRCGCLL